MGEFSSLIFYLFMFTISLILMSFHIQFREKSKFFLILSISIPVFFATYRYGVGTDFFNYMRSYSETSKVSIQDYFNENYIFELGHFIIRKVAFILNSYNIMLGIYATFTLSFIYLALIEYKNKVPIALSFFLFLSIYYPLSLNLMPQFMAISLVLVSFKYIFEKNSKKFLFLILVATLFHMTALIALPIYLLWNKNKNGLASKWKVLISLIICILITLNYGVALEYLTQIEVFSHYNVYALENSQGQNRDFFLKLLLVGLVLTISKPLIKYDKRNKLFIILMIFSLIIGLSGFASPWIKRSSLYFEVVQILLIPSIIQLARTNKDKKIINLAVYLYGIFYFILVYYYLNQANVIPYDFSW